MSTINDFARLAAAARQEPPPAIDVGPAVLRAIEPAQFREPIDRPFLICSGLAAVVAAAAAVVVVQVWSVVDPVVYLFDSLTLVWQ